MIYYFYFVCVINILIHLFSYSIFCLFIFCLSILSFLLFMYLSIFQKKNYVASCSHAQKSLVSLFCYIIFFVVWNNSCYLQNFIVVFICKYNIRVLAINSCIDPCLLMMTKCELCLADLDMFLFFSCYRLM